jgi:histidyl-tRNA synthetase
VREELIRRGTSQAAAERLLALTTGTEQADNTRILRELRAALTTPEARQALDELDTLLTLSADTPAGPLLRLSPALARGLSYYTGPIFEIISPDFSGSLGGGGRYDNLVGMFSNKQVPAVGFSLGLERILLLMEDGRMFPDLQLRAQVMVCPLPDTPLAAVTGLAARLRQAGITVELYPEQAKLGRQLSTADNLDIPYALIIGPDEVARQTYSLKNLATGQQDSLDEASLIAALEQTKK